jgi:polyisoprenyl-phosphate glycosyltransferase
MKLSVIVPVYNEAENLPIFRERVESMMARLSSKDQSCDYELIFVDDHSRDGSADLLRDWSRTSDKIRYMRFTRNCGSHAACSAGLAVADGDCAALLAADLQDPPETIPLLLEQWQSGSDVVWAVRERREGEKVSTKIFSRLYYLLMRKLALPEMPEQGADFVLMDRRVVDVYNSIREKHTSFVAMILWIGFRQTSIHYTKEARLHGKSKWTFAKKVKILIDSLVSFSYAPLRMISGVGLCMAFLGFLYAAFVLYARLSGSVEAGTGFAAIIIVLLIGQGMIMTMMGVLGEYLWRTFDEVRGRPRYVIEEAIDSSSESEPHRGMQMKTDSDSVLIEKER